jgi:CheY-like chemotaxis protein
MPAADTQPTLRVQVVEDLPRVQALLREMIEESGRFQVAAVADSEDEALRQFDALRPDAVVVDLALRTGSGLGVIHAIRSRASPSQPLVIVLTNHALPVLEAACRRAGADHFLDKSRDFHKVHGLLELAARRTH